MTIFFALLLIIAMAIQDAVDYDKEKASKPKSFWDKIIWRLYCCIGDDEEAIRD